MIAIWFGPISGGFACHVDDSMPPTEFVGCPLALRSTGMVRDFQVGDDDSASKKCPLCFWG